MKITTYLKALYKLGWNTSVDVSTYCRTATIIMVLCLLTGMLIGASFMLAYELSGHLFLGIAAASPFIVAALWAIWQNIKVGANRFHDLGYGLRPYIAYVLWAFAIGFYGSYVTLHPDLPLWAHFLAAAMQILSLTISYFLFFEPGVKSAKYKMVSLYTKAPGWIEKIAMVLAIGFIFLSGLRNLAKFMS